MRDKQGFNRMVGRRIRWLREKSGLTQEALANRLGFKDRQTLSAIESGLRNLKATELASLMQIFRRPLDFFTDPLLLLPDEMKISWRAQASRKELEGMEHQLRDLIAAYREFGNLLGEPHIQLDMRLEVRKSDSYERATQLGEGLSSTWGLGPIPAEQLLEVIEEKLHILFLALDTPESVSGAAARLPEFSSLAINRREPHYRRNYDLAHELFHLLTWEQLPPRRIDSPSIGLPKEREENLAEAFAAGLLMPRNILLPRWKARGAMAETEWINRTARDLQVSGEALYWRLVNLKWMKKSAVSSMIRLRKYGGAELEPKPLPPYSRIFVKKLHKVLDRGFVSVRKGARILNCTIEDLGDLFRDYEMAVPFDL